jgi:ABC-2 type transport system permease protein
MLFWRSFTISVMRSLTFRTNLVFELLLSCSATATGVLTLTVVYANIDSLAGWSRDETLILLGCFQILSGLIATFVEPNLLWFNNRVQQGTLDDLLLKPAPALYLTTLAEHAPLGLFNVVLGAITIGFGTRFDLAIAHVAAASVAFACAAVIVWALRTWIALVTFWAPAMTLDVAFEATWQFGRYPTGIYGQPLRALLTFVIPVGTVTTIPAATLAHGADPGQMAAIAGVAVTFALLTSLIWKRAIRRYRSATS